ESISNPQLQVVDLEGVAKLAEEKGLVLIVDSTMTPFVFADFKKLGAHMEIISSTKYISGGGTSVGGLIIDHGTYDWSRNPSLAGDYKKFGGLCFYRKLRTNVYRNLGAVLSPQDAYFQSLGLETLQLRVQKSCANALEIARFLGEHPSVKRVNYPGLPQEGNRTARKQFGSLGGGLLTFDLASQEECFSFMNRLKLIRRATNLNDNKSLIIHPASTIYCEFSGEERDKLGVRDTMIRLSVGIEEGEDLIGDMEQALS
ncbi:MAG: PLP-dependent transferase, partial [Spirochaetales bacterium]|nr:PLP-dependent transferase [Spirochaetales bacterium]